MKFKQIWLLNDIKLAMNIRGYIKRKSEVLTNTDTK
jgi:hypothetical protein